MLHRAGFNFFWKKVCIGIGEGRTLVWMRVAEYIKEKRGNYHFGNIRREGERWVTWFRRRKRGIEKMVVR